MNNGITQGIGQTNDQGQNAGLPPVSSVPVGQPASASSTPKPIPVALVSPPSVAIPLPKKQSSSPWDEELDLPEENNKNQPTIIGTLDPSDTLNNQGAFVVPPEVDEKVGKKIPAKEIVEPPSPQTIITPETNILSPAISPDPLDDFDWFGTGLTETDQTKQTPSPIPIQPNHKNDSTVKQIDIKKPPVLSQEIAQNKPVDIISNPEPLPKPVQPAAVNSNKKRFSLPSLNWKMVALSLGGLGLFFISLTVLTEFGFLGIGFEKAYGALGLEQIWGGLSKNPEKAILQSYSAMREHPNFKAKGEISLTVDGSIKSEITTPLIVGTQTDQTGTNTINSSIEYSNIETSSEAVLLVKSDLGDNKITLLNKNDKLYVSGNENISYKDNKDESKWSAYTIGSLKDKNIQNDFFNLSSGQGLSVVGLRVGSEKVNNEMSYKYSLSSIEIGDTLTNFGISSDMIQTVSGDIWLGVRSKLIRRLALKINTPTSSSVSQINLDINFYDYDVANNISEIDSASIVEAQSIQTGDQKRKSDVEVILSALKKYKDANGSYPNSSDLMVPLNTSGNIVEQALVPTYLSSLPSDDNSVFGWYYAYKSNGERCSVSSRLEKTGDPEGQAVNNLILYIKYSSD